MYYSKLTLSQHFEIGGPTRPIFEWHLRADPHTNKQYWKSWNHRSAINKRCQGPKISIHILPAQHHFSFPQNLSGIRCYWFNRTNGADRATVIRSRWYHVPQTDTFLKALGMIDVTEFWFSHTVISFILKMHLCLELMVLDYPVG